MLLVVFEKFTLEKKIQTEINAIGCALELVTTNRGTQEAKYELRVFFKELLHSQITKELIVDCFFAYKNQYA